MAETTAQRKYAEMCQRQFEVHDDMPREFRDLVYEFGDGAMVQRAYRRGYSAAQIRGALEGRVCLR